MAQETGANWCEPAPAGQRAEWAGLIAQAFVDGFAPDHERADVEELLVQIALDPAVSVRRALAGAIASSVNAPKRLISQLAADCDSVAAVIVRWSPRLSDRELAEIVHDGREKLVAAVMARSALPAAVCAALVVTDDPDRVLRILAHPGTTIDKETYHLTAERWGEDARLRGALFDRADLPAAVRQLLVRRASEAVAASPLVAFALGARSSRRIGEEAAHRGTAVILSETPRTELPILVEELAMGEQLSPAILLRLACSGALDGLAEALARLSGVAPKRVRSILVEGRRKPFAVLAERAGLPDASVPILFYAVDVWRKADECGDVPTSREVAAKVMNRMAQNMAKEDGQTMQLALGFLRGLSRELATTPASGSEPSALAKSA